MLVPYPVVLYDTCKKEKVSKVITLMCFYAFTCADPESYVRGGPNLITFFFLVDEGIGDPNTIDDWLRMGLLPPPPPPLGNFADISYLVEN